MPRESSPKFEAKVDGEVLTLLMYGYIGTDWYGDGSMIDAQLVAKALNQNKTAKEIKLLVNSGGGDAFHALAMYQALKQHGAKIIANIQGIAASAMTIVVCAADVIEMSAAGLYMIHEAQWGTYGTVAEQQATLDATKKTNEQGAAIYAARSGQSLADVKKMMADTTWLTAEEAKAKGFVTSISPLKTMAAEFGPDQFTNVPERIKPLLANLQKGTMSMSNTTTTNPATPVAPAASTSVVETPAAPAAAAPATPATPATPAAPAAATPATDPMMAERQRSSQITAACQMAGHPEVAGKYIEQGTDLATVQSALLTMVCAERQPTANAANGGDPAPANPNAKFEKEFSDNEMLYVEMGLTKESYVKSRRIDEGLEKLPTKTRA